MKFKYDYLSVGFTLGYSLSKSDPFNSYTKTSLSEPHLTVKTAHPSWKINLCIICLKYSNLVSGLNKEVNHMPLSFLAEF